MIIDFLFILLGFFSFGCIIAGLVTFVILKKLRTVTEELRKAKDEYRKLLSQKKSSEIILGQISEKLAPFLEVFKYDSKKAYFLGNPIDYVVFDNNEIIFIEIKSGKSRLTSKQRKIKQLVMDKKIRWEEIKIKPE
jgi:predicted Holliday junction resolvase-like endonuclease